MSEFGLNRGITSKIILNQRVTIENNLNQGIMSKMPKFRLSHGLKIRSPRRYHFRHCSGHRK